MNTQNDNFSNRLYKRTSHIFSKIEDAFLSLLIKIADFSKSEHLFSFIDNYTEKKLQRTKSQLIKKRWEIEKLKSNL